MNDPLEKFIHNNRQKFDDKEPSDGVWEKIDRNINPRQTPAIHWVWKAAAILFFLTSSFLFYQLEFNQGSGFLTSHEEKALLDQEFKSVESFYIQEISTKKEQIYDFEARNANVDEAFEQDLQKLDAMYAVLKDELKTNPSKKVVDALILNLLVRVDILNKALKDLEETSDKNIEGSRV